MKAKLLQSKPLQANNAKAKLHGSLVVNNVLEMGENNGNISRRIKGSDNRNNIVSIQELIGKRGETGKPGKDGNDGKTPIKNIDYFDGKDATPGKDGNDGREIEIELIDNYIKQRYKGEKKWKNLISLDDIKGKIEQIIVGGGAAIGLPAGGLLGQIPSKASNNDYDIVWINNTTLPNPITGAGSSSTNTTYAVQDGTILYHNVRRFVPTSTVSNVGATVTSVGTQFLVGMIGSKLTINGEWRIITAFTSTTQVSVNSAYSTDYTNVSSANWGVYGKLMDTVSGITNFYTVNGNSWIAQSGGVANSAAFAGGGGNFQLGFSGLDLATSHGGLRFSSTTSSSGTKDVGLRRNGIGLLEIYDGVTNGTLRDLTLRTALVNTTTNNGVDSLQVNGSATIGTAGATTSQLNILGGASGTAMVRLVRTSGVSAAFQWALSTGGLVFADEINGGTPLALYGGTTISAHVGLRNTGTAVTTHSLLGATTFATTAGADVNSTNFTIQGSLGVGTGTLGDIYFNTGNTTASSVVHTSTTKMVIKGGGNVGIGGNAPSTKLDVVVTSSDGASSLHGIRINSGFPTNPQALQLGTSDTGQYSWIQSRQQGINNTPLALNPIGGTVIIGGNTPNANAILDVQSTTRAFMPPRMTTVQKNAIVGPTASMMVYDTTLNKLCVYTTVWETVTSL